MIWSSDFSSVQEAEQQASISQSLFFARLMVGKLKEGHEVLQKYYFGARLSQDFEKNGSPDALHALARIKRSFNSESFLRQVRSDFAFHYSPEALDEALPGTPDSLHLYLDNQSNVNTLYYFAEVLANRAILQRTGRADEAQAIEAFLHEMGRVAKDFLVFCGGFMHLFLDRHGERIWVGKAQEVNFENLQRFRSLSLPFFVEVSEE